MDQIHHALHTVARQLKRSIEPVHLICDCPTLDSYTIAQHGGVNRGRDFRAMQFSSGMPMRSSAHAGWAANRWQVAAIQCAAIWCPMMATSAVWIGVS